MKKIICTAMAVIAFSMAAGTVSYAAGNWSEQSGKWYYINNDGMKVSNQLKTINSQKYAFDGSGAMVQDAWYYNNGDQKWYYMGSDGIAVNGWLQLGDKWYYLLSSGSMATDGWRTIDNKRYYFNEDGTMKQNAYVDEKYLDSDGVNDSRYDIKVRGKVDKEVLEEAGNMTVNIPGWLLKDCIGSGWKIACNAEKEEYGKYEHEDYSEEYLRYYALEQSRKLIFFIEPEYVLQGIGLYVNESYGNPSNTEDFQGAYSIDWYSVSNMFQQNPIIESDKSSAFAEVFALYYSEEDYLRERFREDCPSLCAYMDGFMAECYGKVMQK